ncbi:phosphatase PAP2 family protein [Bradyrhizobium sp. 200]|uniref:vanadium-dependent haloperoxidase n=1 Tax=Bradyrhizobium sp. 200 TaxID=2782665 RepID=UPI001FFF4EEA|nr:vanadium-dependent haloperoxidase [Bradyrhizobium sp. 200]UPJ52334.1 phosphatase PAP2 family protein [Bradyrhizobium sp. 200]
MDDPILYWNAVSLECNRRDHTGVMAARNQRGPTLSSRALAIVHIAMHDAYVLTQAGLGTPVVKNDPYLPPALRPTFSTSGSATAAAKAALAVAAAASVALLNLYPSLAGFISDEYARFSSMWGGDEASHRFGSAVGHAVIALRQGDGADDPGQDYMYSAAYGRHRPDPLNPGQGFLGSRYGHVRPFAVSSFHPLEKYPAIGSAVYTAHHAEVYAKGAAATSAVVTRTPMETLVGIYWAYDGVKEIGTPPRLYNQIVRLIAADKGLSTEQSARLFLLINVAMADAGILAWYYKYLYDLWRPIIGIREYDKSMGPSAIAGAIALDLSCDPFWRPLGAPKTNVVDERVRSFTPPFPAYPSGHATFGAASFDVARLYLQSIGKGTINADGTDDFAFQLVSDELNGKSIDPDDTVRTRHMRSFAGLHEAMFENSISRVFLGVHWRFDGTTGTDLVSMLAATDNIGGVPLGRAIAKDIFGLANLRPSPPTVKAPPFDATP